MANAALYGVGPGTSGPAAFNLYDTLPLDQWVEIEIGLWSLNTGMLDRAGAFIVNGKFYGWFTKGESGTDYDRTAMGIVATNSSDDLTVYIDNWYVLSTAGPNGTDNRPTGTLYTKDYTTQRGQNVGYHVTGWEKGPTLTSYGLVCDPGIQSGIEHSRMDDMGDGWSQIVIDWPNGTTPPWPPSLVDVFSWPMVAFRKDIPGETNLEIVPK